MSNNDIHILNESGLKLSSLLKEQDDNLLVLNHLLSKLLDSYKKQNKIQFINEVSKIYTYANARIPSNLIYLLSGKNHQKYALIFVNAFAQQSTTIDSTSSKEIQSDE